MNMTIPQWLNTLVPISNIMSIVDQVLPAFLVVGFMILVIGYHLGIVASESILHLQSLDQ
jgi:xanthine/uracil permease